jgi:fumarylacetoacetase
MASWIDVPADSPFTLATLPYGVFSRDGEAPRAGVAIGDHVLDLAVLARANAFVSAFPKAEQMFAAPTLDGFAGAGRAVWGAVRARIGALLRADNGELRDDANLVATAVLARRAVTMHRPIGVGDYVDFYSSIEHATNIGKILRPDAEPLPPNYRSLPIGYHGRASTVVLSHTAIVRPCGQYRPPGSEAPVFGPTQALDFELELGFVTGPGNALGAPIPIADAGEHIFGCVLLNDWSARDIQAWEYQPLGPFLAKSFATSISPWVVPLEALEPFRVPARAQEPEPLPYLRAPAPWTFDIALEVTLQSARMRAAGLAAQTISRATFARMYWTMAQQLAHVTVNGTRIKPGDLYGSGTISNEDPGSFGSMMELTWRGARPVALPSGETRAFLEDGDTVVMSASCTRGELHVGFGEVSGTVHPARV